VPLQEARRRYPPSCLLLGDIGWTSFAGCSPKEESGVWIKAVFLVLALLGHTSLWLAVLADTGATILVILNALRLLRR